MSGILIRMLEDAYGRRGSIHAQRWLVTSKLGLDLA